MKMPLLWMTSAVFVVTMIGCSCAKKDELDTVRAEAAEARRAADEATSRARLADERSQNAEARALQAEEAVNRSFKRSMRK